MFESYIVNQPKSTRRWPTIIFTVSIISHAGFAAALVIMGMWQLDKLALPKQQPVIVSSTRPPQVDLSEPAPRPKPAPVRRQQTGTKPPREMRQPDDGATEEVEVAIEYGAPDTGGDEQGVSGGNGDGTAGSVDINDSVVVPIPTMEPLKQPPKPIEISVKALDGERISGNTLIQPPESVLMEMVRDGSKEIRGTAKICIDRSGQVSSVKLVNSTGYMAYDRKLMSEMNAWRYRPFQLNGDAIPVCSSITFIYVLRN